MKVSKIEDILNVGVKFLIQMEKTKVREGDKNYEFYYFI